MRDESGVALVIVLGVMMVMTISAVGLLSYSVSNEHSQRYGALNDRSLDLAEASANSALSVLANAADPTNPSTLPPSASPTVDSSYSGGTVSWSGSYDSATTTWTVTGSGVVRNPAGTASINRTVTVKALVSSPASLLSDNPAWSGLSAFTPAACTAGTLAAGETSRLRSPIYVVGDLCLEDTARIESTVGTVTVTGAIRTYDSSQVGATGAGNAVPTLHVGTGCVTGAGTPVFPCTPTQRVWVTTQDQVVTPARTKPPLDLAYWYTNAKPGPSQNCTTGSFPGGATAFENDLTPLNRSLGNVNILPASSYDCTVTIGGQTVGRIAWNNTTKAFTILGTVFFDGNLLMAGAQQATYTGRGTIYFSGTISLGGSDQLCAVRSGTNCNFTTGAWNPDTALLALVAGSSGSGTGVLIQTNARFQGAIYSVGLYRQQNTTQVQGPIVSDRMDIKDSAQVNWSNFTTLAPGMPVSSPSPPTVSVMSGSWNSP